MTRASFSRSIPLPIPLSSQRLASRGLVLAHPAGLCILPLWRHNSTVAALHASLDAQNKPAPVPAVVAKPVPKKMVEQAQPKPKSKKSEPVLSKPAVVPKSKRAAAAAAPAGLPPPIPPGALPLCRLSPALLRCVRRLAEPLLTHIVDGSCAGHATLVFALGLIDARYMPLAALSHYLLGEEEDEAAEDYAEDAAVHRRIGDARYIPSVKDIVLLPAHARAPWEASGAEGEESGGGADAACFSAVAVTLDPPSSSSSSSSSSAAPQSVQLCTVSSSRVHALQTRGTRYVHNVTERLMQPAVRRGAEGKVDKEGEWSTVSVMLDMTALLRPANCNNDDDDEKQGKDALVAGGGTNAVSLPPTIGSPSSSSPPAADASPVARWAHAHSALLAHNTTVWRGVWAAVAEARIAADAKQAHSGSGPKLPAALPTAAETAAKAERARCIAAVPTDPLVQSAFQNTVALLTSCTPAAADGGYASDSAGGHASGSRASGSPSAVCSNEPVNCPPPSLLVPPRVLLELAPQFATMIGTGTSASGSGRTEFASALRRVAAQLSAAPPRSWKSVSAVLLTKVPKIHAHL